MPRSLYSRLALIFISISLITIFIISLIANISTGISFRKYVQERQDRRNQLIINELLNSYKNVGSFGKTPLDEISMYAMMDSLNLKLFDAADREVWSINYLGHHEELHDFMDVQVKGNVKQDYIENTIPIISDGKTVGTLKAGFNGEYSLPYNDISFLNSFNKWLVVAGLISILAALLLNIIVSRHIALPIIKVTEIAQSIREGHLDKRLSVETGTKEISQLTNTINHLAESLENQEKLRKRLTSDVAHELRTPLTTLQSHTEAILDGVWQPSHDRIESIHEEIVRLTKLVKDIERLTEIENDVIKLEKQKFDLKELILGVIRNFEAAAKKKNIILQVDNNINYLEINADKDKLSQVIINLLSNAIKYTADGGRITVDLSEERGHILVKVKDNGEGIEEEHLPHIFERFYRVDNSRTRITGGAGIGLAIVKAIVNAHNGSINVNSKKGEGTEFIILLPGN